jgi:hypothetical protein
MSCARTRILLAAATLAGGILAGSVVDRAVVGGPAWHTLGATAWAQYSRLADLGTGLVAYPVEAIGGALLTVAAAVSNYLDRRMRTRAALPLYLAVAFSLSGLLLTIKAAPIMLALATPPAGALEATFDEFFLWGLHVRGAADVLAFASQVWALAVLREGID